MDNAAGSATKIGFRFRTQLGRSSSEDRGSGKPRVIGRHSDANSDVHSTLTMPLERATADWLPITLFCGRALLERSGVLLRSKSNARSSPLIARSDSRLRSEVRKAPTISRSAWIALGDLERA